MHTHKSGSALQFSVIDLRGTLSAYLSDGSESREFKNRLMLEDLSLYWPLWPWTVKDWLDVGFDQALSETASSMMESVALAYRTACSLSASLLGLIRVLLLLGQSLWPAVRPMVLSAYDEFTSLTWKEQIICLAVMLATSLWVALQRSGFFECIRVKLTRFKTVSVYYFSLASKYAFSIVVVFFPLKWILRRERLARLLSFSILTWTVLASAHASIDWAHFLHDGKSPRSARRKSRSVRRWLDFWLVVHMGGAIFTVVGCVINTALRKQVVPPLWLGASLVHPCSMPTDIPGVVGVMCRSLFWLVSSTSEVYYIVAATAALHHHHHEVLIPWRNRLVRLVDDAIFALVGVRWLVTAGEKQPAWLEWIRALAAHTKTFLPDRVAVILEVIGHTPQLFCVLLPGVLLRVVSPVVRLVYPIITSVRATQQRHYATVGCWLRYFFLLPLLDIGWTRLATSVVGRLMPSAHRLAYVLIVTLQIFSLSPTLLGPLHGVVCSITVPSVEMNGEGVDTPTGSDKDVAKSGTQRGAPQTRRQRSGRCL